MRSIVYNMLTVACVVCFAPCSAFHVGSKHSISTLRKTRTQTLPFEPSSMFRRVNQPTVSATRNYARKPPTVMKMYNLPPSGGGNGGGGFRDILSGVVSLALIVAFFASPLGGLFFAVINSFFVLSLVLPIFLWITFQGWQFFNTIEGSCPQCGAPVRVLKAEASPSICLNCGSFIVATPDKSAVDFYREKDQVIVDEDYTASIWDSLISGPMGARSAPPTPQQRQAQLLREQTIIDVEVEEKD